VGPDRRTVVDFKESNLHVVSYSTPVDTELDLEDLQKHLYSMPDQPDAIPYVTSYYQERWGFCLTHRQRLALQPGRYKVRIESELKQGALTYGEAILPGTTEKEVLLSTYICHPSLANNELSGPCVTAFLAVWLRSLSRRRHTFRIVFLPETIGSICYLSRHAQVLRERVVAGFVVTCIGDDRCYSYLPSRAGNTLSDRAALHALRFIDPEFKRYTFLERGSDERQYCSPGIDLPVATIMRSKYATYPEYHTSLDNLQFVTPNGLQGGYTAIRNALEIIESNVTPKARIPCEPQLGRRGLYPTLGTTGRSGGFSTLLNLLAYADGQMSLLDIADLLGLPFSEVLDACSVLKQHDLVSTH
jgi:aminopeptidase-like protein